MARKICAVNNRINLYYKYHTITTIIYINENGELKDYLYIVCYVYPHIIMLYVVNICAYRPNDNGPDGNRSSGRGPTSGSNEVATMMVSNTDASSMLPNINVRMLLLMNLHMILVYIGLLVEIISFLVNDL